MTVVIMSMLWDGHGNRVRKLFGACDKMLSSTQMSLHMPFSKIRELGPTWMLGFAGAPAPFMPIGNEVVDALDDNPDLSSSEVVRTITTAYQNYRVAQISDAILSPYGIDLSEFRANGLAIFGPLKFGELCNEISAFDLGTTLLLGGWSPATLSDPRLTIIANPGVAFEHAVLGSAAIGSGADIALGHLYACHNVAMDTIDEGRYRILEAKFMSEAARSVGPDTVLVGMSPDAEFESIRDGQCEAFRTLWAARRREVPLDISTTLTT